MKEVPFHIYHEATELLKRAKEFHRRTDIGVTEATWYIQPQYPTLPVAILHATDIHYGSTKVDYDLLDEHLSIVENTPNFYMVTNGDHVDNFNVTGKWASAVYENPIPPQLQTMAFIEKFRQLDMTGKVGVMSFGNHDNFIDPSGYDWFNSFARGLNAPVFTSGGYLHVVIGNEYYGIALTHQYWGNSKLNPTNMAKRFWEHEYPQADIVLLGHTHQSELLFWERGGKERLASIGGTYKSEDMWARKHGLGGRGGEPGHVLVLFPDEHKITAFKDPKLAQTFILSQVYQEQEKGNYGEVKW